MIQFRKLSIARGARRLVNEADLQIHAGWRVGLTGANGSGKSSLFALLRGELLPEAGDCTLPAAWRIASVAQETPALDTAAIDHVLDGDRELRTLQAQLADTCDQADGARIAEVHARYGEIGGYGAEARAAALLSGLGFAEADHRRPVKTFSGGWRMRLNLAQALVSRADLLLLDEPTNHLDLDAVVWLERWLAAVRGTLLVISHDREFIDGCVTHIAHIENAELRLNTGNYSAFEEARAARLSAQQAMYEKQQRVIAHMESYVERFRAKATKARQAQSRLKALARLERIAAAHVDTPFSFSVPTPEKSPSILISLEEVSCAYGQRPILSGLGLQLRPGDRIGLLGANGAGKSTLMKLLAGEAAPASGHRDEGKDLVIGYFAQHQLEQLRGDESPLRHLQRAEPAAREQDLRDYLGGFDFRGSMADAAVQYFSGGEKSRLALALLIRHRPNLLLLDEPTNHLDLEMRQALTSALAEYEGSLVLVSHDRALLRAACDEFLLVTEGRVEAFDGSVDDYIEWLTTRRNAAAAGAASVDKTKRRDTRESAAAGRQARLAARRPLARECAQIELDLARWQQEHQALDQRLADPALYASGDGTTARALGAQQQALAQTIEAAELRWIALQEALEKIGEV